MGDKASVPWKIKTLNYAAFQWETKLIPAVIYHEKIVRKYHISQWLNSLVIRGIHQNFRNITSWMKNQTKQPQSQPHWFFKLSVLPIHLSRLSLKHIKNSSEETWAAWKDTWHLCNFMLLSSHSWIFVCLLLVFLQMERCLQIILPDSL